MGRVELQELQRRRRAQMIKLMEVSDLTGQLSQAARRNDRISMMMLLSMREEPLQQLQEMDDALRRYLLTLPVETAIRFQELLNGAPALTEEEVPVCEQMGQYRRLLQNVSEADRYLSTHMGGNRSFYRKFRK